jgi:Arc/MetJ-type ribon-helix-helix transcriptional regulator
MSIETQEGIETTEGQDSSVIRDLRERLRKAEAKAAVADQVRSAAAESLLVEAGYPKLKDLFLERVQDAPTPEKVTEFLDGLGLAKAQASAEGQSDAGQEQVADAPASRAQELAGISRLGQQVAVAAEGGTNKPSIADRLNQAKNAAEVQAIMAEAELTMQI